MLRVVYDKMDCDSEAKLETEWSLGLQFDETAYFSGMHFLGEAALHSQTAK
jgi:hypothetical protein